MKRILYFISICCLCTVAAHAQQKMATISGQVKDDRGEPIADVTVYLEKTSYKTETGTDGKYTLTVPAGNYTLVCTALGYEKRSSHIQLKDNQQTVKNFSLEKDDQTNLAEVEVVGKNPITVVRESPYNVVALDAKQLYNTTLDLAHMLDRASGVTIRENGGVGSNMSISLNGFTGRQIKLFMDGVPMEGFGSAFQLNNIPVGIADRIEIYKGVVPIEFGGDAMGGVINIVTKKIPHSYADISYSYGSFNTHKTSVDLGYTAKSGFTAQLTAFQNYSDNDYKVYTQILDLATSTYSLDSQWVRRFNDTYHNETVMAKIGFVKTKWADRAMLGLTLGQEDVDIQQAYLMRIVYGERKRRGTTVMPSLNYAKSNFLLKNLNLNFTGTYNKNYNENIDTARRQYNWLGEYREKATQGEGLASLSEFNNRNGSINANITYRPSPKHIIAVSEVYSNFTRKLTDRAMIYDNISAADSMRREESKNVVSASYRYEHNQHLNATLFGKHYGQWVTGPVDTSQISGREAYALRATDYSVSGYGAAATYLFDKEWQVKASYEKAYRLPTETELFGDGVLEQGDASLRAEHSNNYNLGFTYNAQYNETHGFYADVSLMYRDINDYIRRIANDQRYGSAYYTNQGKVQNQSVNAELKYFYKRWLNLGTTVTYQNLRNKQRYQTGTTIESTIYDDRVPNVPYFFGSTEITAFFHDFLGKGNLLTATHNMQYTHEFYIDWPSLGAANTKDRLPTQISHDLLLTCALQNGRYNLSFEARNFTNSLLYDNFSLQKPGRAFYLKLRYYITLAKN